MCLGIISACHKVENSGKLHLGSGKKAPKIARLTDDEAVELGADVWSELVVYSLACLTVYLEHVRLSKNKTKQAETQEERLNRLEEHISELEVVCDKHQTEMSKMTALTMELHRKLDDVSQALKSTKSELAKETM